MNNNLTQQGRNAKTLLMPYLLTLLALTVVTHIVIAIRGPKIDAIDIAIFFVTSFVPYLIYYVRRRNQLRQIRFGPLVGHAGTFAIVNVGWQLHAYIQTATAPQAKWDAAAAVGALPIDDTWFGPTMGMTAFWGIGLIAHFLASTYTRGFESR